MKRKLYGITAFSIAALLTLQSVSPVLAYKAGSQGSSSSSSSVSVPTSPPASSSSNVSTVTPVTEESTYIGNGCSCSCTPLNNYTVYHPKVTILHNVNANIAKLDNKSVYYIPTLADLPFDLGNSALSVKEKNGKTHNFALVYRDLFDAETAFANDKSTTSSDKNCLSFFTTKDFVSDNSTGSVAVNSIGPDILLVNEKFKVDKAGSGHRFSYLPSIAGTAPLMGDEVVMDLYKALGVFEYRVQYTFAKDEHWDTNSSPILNEIDFLTDTAGTDGLDISESRCDVSVSRTCPNYYWKRYKKDGVNTGIQNHDMYSLSDLVHVNSPLQKDSTVTLAQFMNVAVALMNLYGEAAITDAELQQFESSYPMLMATSGELTDAERASLKYLVIKGIIEEQELVNANWHSPVHLQPKGDDDGNYIITWLGRIARPESRVSMKEPVYVPPTLAEAGYAATPVEFSDPDVTELVVKPVSECNSYDLLIEYSDALSGTLDDTRSCFVAYADDIDSASTQTYTTSNFSSSQSTRGLFTNSASLSIDIDKLKEENNVDSVDEDTLQSIGLLSAEGMVALSDANIAPSIAEVGTVIDDISNNYYYVGTREFDGKHYYHFKISKSFKGTTTLNFETNKSSAWFYATVRSGSGYVPLLQYTQSSSGKKQAIKTISCKDKLNIAGGGVIPLGATKPETFESEGFDRSFIDANALAHQPMVKLPMADEQYIYSFYFKKNSSLKKYFGSKQKKETGVDWTKMLNNEKLRLNENVSLECKPTKDGEPVTVTCRIELAMTKNNKKCYFVQILTNSKETVEKWSLIKKQSKSKKLFVDSDDNNAYVLADNNGSLQTMVSCETLKNAGYINAYQEVSEDVFVITVGTYNNNIVLNKKYNFVIAGNTLILPKNRENTILYTKDPDKGWLICLEACLGWSGTYSYLRDSSNGTIISNDSLYDFDATTQTNSLKSITTFFPSTMTKAMWTDYKKVGKNGTEVSGLNMTSTYALAPYLVVMDMDQDATNMRSDWLFVWHRQNAVISSKSKVETITKKDKFAREKFASLISTETNDVGDLFDSIDSKSYCLIAYKLNVPEKKVNVNHTPDKSTDEYLAGFSYRQLSRKGIGKNASVTSGWTYTPIKFSTVTKGLAAYARAARHGYYYKNSVKEEASSQEKTALPIPIFECNGVLYDANVNFCGTTEGDYLPLGTMVGKTLSSSSASKLYSLDDKGHYQVDSNSSADGYSIFTAPVSQFAALKGMGSTKVNELRSGAVYFGTSRCRLIKGELTLGDMSTSIPNDAPAVISYFSTGNNTVYCITSGTSSLSNVLERVETVLEYAMTDPDNIVDWTNYKMNRAIANADAWSSVALIFVLQILPRVAMLMFMLLMILSLVKDWKPWQKLCHNTFDVYKLLTLGHQSVDTIDTKRVFIISLVCAILMIMILNNTLFEFMMYIAQFLIVLFQR